MKGREEEKERGGRRWARKSKHLINTDIYIHIHEYEVFSVGVDDQLFFISKR